MSIRRISSIIVIFFMTIVLSITGAITSPAAQAAAPGTIEGRVTSQLDPEVGVHAAVRLYLPDGTNIDLQATDADGNFVFGGLAPGSYRLDFGRSGYASPNLLTPYYYQGAASLAASPLIVVGSSTGVDLGDVEVPPGAVLSGTLETTESESFDSFYTAFVLDSAGFVVQSEDLNGALPGSFEISGLWPGDYVVMFGPTLNSWFVEYWNDVRQFEDATIIQLSSQEVVDVGVVLLEKKPLLTGTVIGDSGGSAEPVQFADVTIFTADGVVAGYATTNSAGQFSYPLEPATYKVRVTTANYEFADDWAPMWVGGGQRQRDAAPIVIGDDDVDLGEIVLEPTVTIQGAVTGVDTDDVDVVAYRLDDVTGRWELSGSADAVDSGSGEYQISALAAGRYRVQFVTANPIDSQIVPEYWPEAPTAELAGEIVLEAGETIDGIDAALETWTGMSTERVAGADRFAVAADLAREFDSPDTVFIVNGLNYPDALSTAPYAARLGAPLLLVTPDQIPAAVGAVLAEISPSKIIIVGGPRSVSSAVEAALQVYAPTVERITGVDRFDASRGIAKRFGFADEVFVATGFNFPDALSAGAVAADHAAPLVIVDGRSGPDAATLETFADLGVESVRIVGGPNSVSAAWAAGVEAAGFDVTRFDGADRYEASQSVNGAGPIWTSVAYLAVGTKFPDALAGSALAGVLRAPLYVVPPTCVPAGVLEDLERKGVEKVIILGGTASLTSSVDSLTPCP